MAFIQPVVNSNEEAHHLMCVYTKCPNEGYLWVLVETQIIRTTTVCKILHEQRAKMKITTGHNHMICCHLKYFVHFHGLQ